MYAAVGGTDARGTALSFGKKEALSFAMTWVELEITVLSEMSQEQNHVESKSFMEVTNSVLVMEM